MGNRSRKYLRCYWSVTNLDVFKMQLDTDFLSTFNLAFTLYGGFWMSYAAILIPGTGILAAYADYPDQLKSALAIYLLSWTILTFLLL